MFRFEINDKIYLKLFNKNEAEELHMLIKSNKDHLKNWLAWVDDMENIEEVKDFIKKTRQGFAAEESISAGMWYKEELVGVIGYNNIDWKNKKANLGYWLGQDHQGEGIVTTACKALVDNAFNNFNLNKVEISCAEGNVKSRAIPERLGFKQEGIIRDAEWLYDKFVNHIRYGMLAEEWE
ncbi:MAG: GNAT family N-acetyltransferase [Halanaerobiales bacterium]|nr:GNAT family N-acetyltransferase [Halanaerobiales bacterium]